MIDMKRYMLLIALMATGCSLRAGSGIKENNFSMDEFLASLRTADENIFKNNQIVRHLVRKGLLEGDIRVTTRDGYYIRTITVKERRAGGIYHGIYHLSFVIDDPPCFLYEEAIALTGADDAQSRHSLQRMGRVSTEGIVAGLLTDLNNRNCLGSVVVELRT